MAGDGGTLRVDDQTISVDGGGPSGAVIEGLQPDTRHTLVATAADGRPQKVRFKTLATLPGAELCRFATINDVHIGALKFGTFRPFWDAPGATMLHPERCARAALSEAKAWGASMIVAKGDLTQEGSPEQWQLLGDILASTDLPTIAVTGNHDTISTSVDGTEALAAVGVELVCGGVTHRDLDGVRIIGIDTTIPARHHGRTDHVLAETMARASDADGPVFVGMHHYPQRFGIPNVWPPGIPGAEAGRFLDGLAAANRASFVAAGHSHRNRRHLHRDTAVTEVGSTKDYPGVWAGYVVHESGIRQVVRRTIDPTAVGWTDQGRMVLGGLWGWWADGPRSHRCFNHRWVT